jgi:hypothetical protein
MGQRGPKIKDVSEVARGAQKKSRGSFAIRGVSDTRERQSGNA